MKKLFSFVFAFFVFVGICSANGQKMNIDYESKRNLYGDFVIIPMDKTVTVTDSCITIAPKSEDVTYTISGYFNGQIVNKTKNTVLKLKNVFIENNKGEAAIYGFAKTEISTSRGTENYIISTGSSDLKNAAIQCKKNLEMGGSGTAYVVGEVYHGVKGDDVKFKGSGVYYIQGTESGSTVNCHSFIAEKEKSFKLYMLNSKNGIKADNTIMIESGNFYSYNNGTAFKTDTLADNPTEKHGIFISNGSIRVHKNEKVFDTEEKFCKVRPKVIEE